MHGVCDRRLRRVAVSEGVDLCVVVLGAVGVCVLVLVFVFVVAKVWTLCVVVLVVVCFCESEVGIGQWRFLACLECA